jgi:hypothetical protein
MDTRGRLIVFVGFTCLGMCFCWMKRETNARVDALRAATEESAERGPPIEAPPRSAEQLVRDEESHLRRLASTDPRLAVREARLLLGSDAGPMAALARRLLPQLLLEDARRAVREKRFDDAEATVGELEALEGADEPVEAARKLLQNAATDRLWAAVNALDDAKAEALLEKELLRRGETRFELNRDVPARLADRRLKKWVEAGRPYSGAGLDDLETAAQLVVSAGYNNPVVEAFTASGARTLADKCRTLDASERRAAAVLCWKAARAEVTFTNNTGDPAQRVAEERAVQLDDAKAKATLRLMDEVASRGSRWIPPRTALDACGNLFNEARDRGDLARRKKEPDTEWKELAREVVTTRIRLWVAEAKRQLTHGTPEGALNALDLLYRTEVGWLFGVKVAEGWNAWDHAPEELRRGIDPDGKLNAADRAARLRSAVEQAKWTPDLPELMSARSVAVRARTQWGLSLLDGKDKARRELGEELLRAVLRETVQVSESAQIVAALQDRLRGAGRESDFGKLLELASFYAAEVALGQSRDGFREELKALLVSAAEHYRQSQGLERLFLLTLIADLFPADAEGRAAREEALATFFQTLERARATPPRDPAQLPPSGLAGLTVAAVENATSHHLLLFYDGPERFFVRISPRRRGSVVLRDGKYRHGAVVTDASIVPARGEPEYQSKFLEIRYRIVTERGGKVTDDLGKHAVPLGTYPLLRAPEGEHLKVDLDSGRVSRSP